MSKTSKAQTVTIDNIVHKLSDLGDTAKKELENIRITEEQLKNLQIQQAITQTARNAYANALKKQLPKKAPANTKESIVTIEGVKYEFSSFSKSAQSELISLHEADKRIEQLKNDIAFTQTARNAYARELQTAIKK